PPSPSPEVRQEITDDAAGTELPFKEKMRRTSEAASKGEPVLVPKTKENKYHVAKPIANRT
ncbi:MAG: hypothetical protein WCL39_09685, partial [Armatimonadota bacterium]